MPSSSNAGLAGLTVCCVLAGIAAVAAAAGASRYGFGWLPLSMLLGIAVGNLVPAAAERLGVGVAMARGGLMRAGIALFGLGIGVHELGQVGWSGALMAALVVLSTLLLSLRLGRWLGLETHCALLIGAGSAICGAAAVAAANGVLDARPRHVSAAVAAVVVFGTLGMYVFPVLYPLLSTSASAFGMWIGLTVHELGHVVAAGSAINPEVAASALVEKMLRVMLLAPAMLCLAAARGGDAEGRCGPRVPLFVWAFCVAIAINASGVLPAWLQHAGTLLAQALLATGLTALGMTTRWREVRAAGLRVWILAGLLWVWLMAAGFALVSVLA